MLRFRILIMYSSDRPDSKLGAPQVCLAVAHRHVPNSTNRQTSKAVVTRTQCWLDFAIAKRSCCRDLQNMLTAGLTVRTRLYVCETNAQRHKILLAKNNVCQPTKERNAASVGSKLSTLPQDLCLQQNQSKARDGSIRPILATEAKLS